METGRKAGIAVFVVLILLGITAYGLLVVDRPRIQAVETSWGTVTENRSEVETTISVENPLLVRAGDTVGAVEYTVALNGITVADERIQQVQLSGPYETISTSTWVNNDKVPRWWVSHINRNETTTVAVNPTVVAKYGGIDAPADEWTRRRTVRTDLLEPVNRDRQRRISAFDRTVFVVNETSAEWGTATRAETPIDASITATNALPVRLPVTEVQYTIRLNGIVVGQGTAGEQTVIEPGETRTLDSRARIDNSRLDEWWVTHLQNNQTSRLSVSFTATVDYGGRERQLPLDSLSYNRTFRTDVLQSGAQPTTPESALDSNSATTLPPRLNGDGSLGNGD